MTSNQATPLKSECRFCQIGSGGASLAHDRVVLESDNYFAVASIGGFIEGWTLVCTKRHALNLSDDYHRPELQSFVSDVSDILSAEYGGVVAFEHGVACSGSLTGCGTDHAHLHLVPYSGSFVGRVIEHAPARHWDLKSTGQLANWADGREYLLMTDEVKSLPTAAYVSRVEVPESQFFRKVLASSIGREGEYDYRTFPFVESVRRTSERLREIAHAQQPA